MTEPSDRQPSVIERAGIRTTRRSAAIPGSAMPGEGLIDATVTGSGAAITMTVPQAHELLDQLAMHLGRPDLIVTHRHMPQRRTQPGGTK